MRCTESEFLFAQYIESSLQFAPRMGVPGDPRCPAVIVARRAPAGPSFSSACPP